MRRAEVEAGAVLPGPAPAVSDVGSLREPGAILLVACYELGHQPLAVAWPAAFLEARGYRPAVLDVSVEPFGAERARGARLAAVSVPMHTALHLGVGVARRIRETNPACHIVFYGHYASLNAEHLLDGIADAVIGGEAEGPLCELVEALAAGDAGPVPGVRTRMTPAGPHLGRLAFPVPSRTALPPLPRYAHLEHDGHRQLVASVQASRGCRHRCRHCPIPPVYGGRFFVVPVEVVLADVRQQVRAGAGHVSFGDPDFLNGPRHALAVARAVHSEFPQLTFDVTAKVEHLLRHRARLPELRALGCLFVVSAVESLSDTVLAHLDKGHTRGDVLTLVGLMREAGIALRPTWVAFTPWTTLADYRDMLDFVEAEALVDLVDPVQYSLRLLVPPGSLLAGHPSMRAHLGPLEADAFLHPWRHPDPRMDALQAAVSRAAGEGAEAEEDPALTFDRVRRLAEEVAGAPDRALARVRLAADRPRPPRLTEPWFC